MKSKHIALIISVLFLHQMIIGQAFINGDLEGTVSYVSIPPGWDSIPYTDPICEATTASGATVDVLNESGPGITSGTAGYPFSGNTFVSGLHANNGSSQVWHEGIMQTVSGFSAGSSYTISLYQAVVKQQSAADNSGSWKVYLDSTLIATTDVTTSYLFLTNLNLQWERREVTFIATEPAHTIKFIPWDDDSSQLAVNWDSTGALRMGIDSVTLSLSASNNVAQNSDQDLVIAPNPTSDYIQVQCGSPILEVTIMDRLGRTVHKETPKVQGQSINLSMLNAGYYTIQVVTEGKSYLRKILIIGT